VSIGKENNQILLLWIQGRVKKVKEQPKIIVMCERENEKR
jgi:hypothetical protein